MSLLILWNISELHSVLTDVFCLFFPGLRRGSLGQQMSLGVKVAHRQARLPSASAQIWAWGTLGVSKEKWQLKKPTLSIHSSDINT